MRLRAQLARFLGTQGHEAREAGSVGEALALLQMFGAGLTLVLLNTPLDEDAATVGFAVRRSAPNAALVLMGQETAVSEFRLAVGGEIRPEATLEKPFTARQLSTLITEVGEAYRAARSNEAAERETSAQLDEDVGALEAVLAGLGRGGPGRGEAASIPPPFGGSPISEDDAAFVDQSLDGYLDDEDIPGIDDSLLDPAMVSVEVAGGLDAYTLTPMVPDSPHAPRGIYGPITVAELIYNCFRDLHSGLVVIQRGEAIKTLRVMNGRPVQAESNVRSETLGTMLQQAGRITEDQRRRSVAMAKRGRLRQGEALVRLGAIQPEDLRDALREQVRARILGAFAWTNAAYGLSYDPEVAVGIEPVEINPLMLIFEGVRSTFPLGPLLKRYDDCARRFVQATPRLSDYTGMLREYRQGLEIAHLCDGNRVLTDVLRDSPVGLVDTLRLLRALELMACIQLTEERASAPQRIGRASTPPRRVTGWTTDGFSPEPPPRTTGPLPQSGSRSPLARQVSRPPSAAPRTITIPPSAPPPPGEPVPTRPSNGPASQRPQTGASHYRSGGRTTDGGRAATPSGAYRALPRREASEGAAPRPATAGARETPTRTTGPVERPSMSGLRPPVRQTSREEPVSSSLEGVVSLIRRIAAAKNHYEALGMDPTAPSRALADEGRVLLRRLHPDRVMEEDPLLLEEARTVARKLAEAVEVLADRRRRVTYDALTLPAPPLGRGVDLLGAEASFNKGLICLQHSLPEKARDFFNLAIEQDPHQGFYKIHLTSVSFALTPADDRRARTRLMEEAREVVEATGKDEAWCMVADMAMQLGSTDVATRLYNRALQVNSGCTRAREGLLAIERGNEPQADARNTGLFGKIFTRR
ncbi:MAG: hypothetical protein H6706_20340 [Myxococcales bacterium]|nr:hypothetical protein [Myxococcales bacterium]